MLEVYENDAMIEEHESLKKSQERNLAKLIDEKPKISLQLSEEKKRT